MIVITRNFWSGSDGPYPDQYEVLAAFDKSTMTFTLEPRFERVVKADADRLGVTAFKLAGDQHWQAEGEDGSSWQWWAFEDTTPDQPFSMLGTQR